MGAPNVGFLADLYHLAKMGEDLADVLDRYRETILHVQVADPPGAGRRGRGRLDFEPLFGQLAEQGYEGWVGLEYLPAGRVGQRGQFGGFERRLTLSETLVIRSRRMVLPDGVGSRRRSFGINGSSMITDYDARLDADRAVDLGDLALLPGLVDSHVHVNEPGRTEWEGFASATRAALAGGVTTICDMPLNSVPVTTSVDALRGRPPRRPGSARSTWRSGAGRCRGTLRRSGALLDAGVVGFKCFLIDSGIAEFPPLARDELRAAMKALAAAGAPMIVHAEDPAEVTVPAGPTTRSSPPGRRSPSGGRSRPSSGRPRPPGRGRTSCTSPPGSARR